MQKDAGTFHSSTPWGGMSKCFVAVLLFIVAVSAISQAEISFTKELHPFNPVVNDQGVGFYNGCAWADYDGDGWMDLFVISLPQSFLYHNEAGSTFTSNTTSILVNDSILGRGATWADYDNDGDVDLLVSGAPSALYNNAPNETVAICF